VCQHAHIRVDEQASITHLADGRPVILPKLLRQALLCLSDAREVLFEPLLTNHRVATLGILIGTNGMLGAYEEFVGGER
jgi:hypothetical protein